MREIKFRAWDKLSGTMRYGAENSVIVFRNSPNDFELMQFTGLLDKNLVEIYEGDRMMSDKGVLATVFYSNKRAGYSVKFPNVWGKRLDDFFYRSLAWAAPRGQVIGNIYSNPELIKEA